MLSEFYIFMFLFVYWSTADTNWDIRANCRSSTLRVLKQVSWRVHIPVRWSGCVFLLLQADLSVNVQDDSNSFYGVSSQYESAENTIITSSTKVCSFGKQVVEKVEVRVIMKDNFIIILLRKPLPEHVSLCNCFLLSSTKLQHFKKKNYITTGDLFG